MSDEAAARNGFNLASKSVAAATDMPISPAHPAPALPVPLLDPTLTAAPLYTCNFSPFDVLRFALSTPLPFPLPDSSPTTALTLSSLMTSVPRSSLQSFHAHFAPSLPLLDSDVPQRLHKLLPCAPSSLIPVLSIPKHTPFSPIQPSFAHPCPFISFIHTSLSPLRSIFCHPCPLHPITHTFFSRMIFPLSSPSAPPCPAQPSQLV